MSNSEEFWKIRAEKYNQLGWVNDDSYISRFICAADFEPTDLVLDVGVGTGAIANAISPLVREVIGLDLSQDMLNNCHYKDNVYLVRRDILESIFAENIFDKVTARMVFHHILENTQKAADECYHVLKPGGKFILGEGIPPTPEVKDDYAKLFELKEERLTFLQKDLENLLRQAGFKNIQTHLHIMPNFSVRNWLANSGLPQETQDKIYDLHIFASDVFKNAYDMKITDTDCLITVKNLIVVGEK